MARTDSWENLVKGVINGDVRLMARLITVVENRQPGWQEAMKRLYPESGSATVIGITGSPGAGKSSLTASIALKLAEKNLKVGIIAVDPSSPFSGGAILGDRLRMQKLFTCEQIFIRSMATRGMLGGLCHAARDSARILDVFGKEIIIIETVGVGQDEVDIVKTADQVMVVCVPGQGDSVQAIKAGIMEIADLFVVNKADKPGADEVVADIQSMLELSVEADQSIPSVIKTSVVNNQGIDELVEQLLQARQKGFLSREKESLRIRAEMKTLLEEEIFRTVSRVWQDNEILEQLVMEIRERKNDPYSAVQAMMQVYKSDKN